MYGTHFYFGSVRKVTAIFGNMFAALQIQRTDGTTSKLIDVPLHFSPKHEFLIKLNEQARNDSEVSHAITLPRMSFEIVGLTPDPTRKLESLRFVRTEDVVLNKYLRQYNATPWMINFDLNIWTQYIDDMLQIIEQILPNFNPSINTKIAEMPLMSQERDVPFFLEGVNVDNGTPEGTIGIGNERLINWVLSFSAKINLYPPIQSVPVIKRVIENIIANDNEKKDAIITTEVSPFNANYGDVWTVVQTIEEF